MKGKFKLEFTPRFRKSFMKLSREVQLRIIREVRVLVSNLDEVYVDGRGLDMC